jgi:hypothetical protein
MLNVSREIAEIEAQIEEYRKTLNSLYKQATRHPATVARWRHNIELELSILAYRLYNLGFAMPSEYSEVKFDGDDAS